MTELEKQLLDVARSILADDMLPLLPAEYVAKVRSAIATAEAAATSAQPAPNYPAVPDGWPDESWLINTILKFRIGETPHGIETAQRCARLISRRYSAAMLAAAQPATVKDSLIVQQAPAIDTAQIVEQIAQQWDECEYEASGGNIDIGAAIRAAGARLAAEATGGSHE
ncbi:hypothetical protein [Chromobacterium sp.]|uniref:hypothetical protein n=1 Tax=Chromobacterium sp. TaxID=306190 RepID=UPI0035AEDF21